MTAKKTPATPPGPWRYDYELGYCGEIIAANGTTVAAFVEEPSPEVGRLLAAAPALLEALKGVLRVADRQTDEFDAARAAIAQTQPA